MRITSDPSLGAKCSKGHTMPPSNKTPVSTKACPTPGGEMSLVVALMEQIEGMRADLRTQTESITNKLDTQNKEVVKKIDDNAAEARKEFSDIRSDIADMKVRLAEGSERMKNMRRDIDDTKGRCAVHSTTALEKKRATDDETRTHNKKGMPWWLPLLVGGALAFVGEKLARFVINGLADPPAAAVNAPAPAQAPPTPAQPANANNITIDLGQQKR